MAEKLIGATVVLVAIYLFVANSQGADKVLRGLASSYAQVVVALQGRGNDYLA